MNLGLTGRDLLTTGSGADLFDLRGAGGLAHVLTVGKMAPGSAFTYAACAVNDALLHPDGRRAILACGDGSVRIESLCPNGVKAAQDAGELGTAWTTLGAKDAQAAYWATWALGLSGERAVKAIASRLDEAGGAGDRFAGLLKQLNDASPQVREQAEQKLGQSGLPGAVAMLAALEALPQAPPEPRERIAGVLATIELRWRRAVRVLELIGSAESRQLLVRIAKSHPLAEAKQDAAAVLAAQEMAAARFKQ